MRPGIYLLVFMLTMSVVGAGARAAERSAPTTNLTLSLKDPPAVTRVTRDIITIEGSVTPEVAAKFAALQGQDVRILTIYSGGGDPPSARAVGRVVHQRHLDVTVTGVCAGACAKYIFLAGAQRVLAPGSVVAFSDSAASLSLLAANDPEPAVRAIYAGEAAADRSYYQELGLPERLLYDPQTAMETQCYAVLRDEAGRVIDIGHMDKYKFAVFPKDYFDEIGLAVTGDWPGDPGTMLRVAARQFRPNTPLKLLIHVNVRSLAEVQAGLRQTKPCPASAPGH
jgi:hypothetical protein